jgi:hypothetical protein
VIYAAARGATLARMRLRLVRSASWSSEDLLRCHQPVMAGAGRLPTILLATQKKVVDGPAPAMTGGEAGL